MKLSLNRVGQVLLASCAILAAAPSLFPGRVTAAHPGLQLGMLAAGLAAAIAGIVCERVRLAKKHKVAPPAEPLTKAVVVAVLPAPARRKAPEIVAFPSTELCQPSLSKSETPSRAPEIVA